VTLNDGMVAALRKDFRTAPISNQDKIMLEYVVKLTKDATQCSPEDHKKLRAVGFDDKGILQITLMAAWFNYINKVADALGVGRDGQADSQ
jgi:alkylhydroperoxidase family enzyme